MSYSLLVSGSVTGQVVAGNNNVLINAAEGSSVTVRSDEPPQVQRRERPVSRPIPKSARSLVGRADEVARVLSALDRGTPVQVIGVPGIGKSALVREVASLRVSSGHDVVFLSGAGVPVEDLLQVLFQACYDADDYRPEPSRLRRLMGSVKVTVIVDDFDGSPDELATLLDAVPAGDVLIASPTATLDDTGLVLRLDGLSEAAAEELVSGELGGTDRLPQEVIAAAQGHPAALLRAVAEFLAGGRPGEAVSSAIAARLSERARVALGVLCALDTAVSAELLSVLAGEPIGNDVLAELDGHRLVEPDPAGFRAVQPHAGIVYEHTGTSVAPSEFAGRLVAWVQTEATLQAVADTAPVILFALRSAPDDQESVRDLARITAPVLARTLRWGSWREVLALGKQAAQRTGAAADEAYFTKEEGVRTRAVIAGLAVGGAVGGAVLAGTSLGSAAGSSTVTSSTTAGVAKGKLVSSPLLIGGATAATIITVIGALTFASPKNTATTSPPTTQDVPWSETTTQPDVPRPGVTIEPRQDDVSSPPTLQDTFPVDTRTVGKTVYANGFAVMVRSVSTQRGASGPEMVIDTVITNQLWSSDTHPTLPVVESNGRSHETGDASASTFPKDQSVPDRFIAPLDSTFRWEDAVLVFPVRGGAQQASIPLGNKGKLVALDPKNVIFEKTALKSGRVSLTFLPRSFFRNDAAMDTDLGCCPDREWPASNGLQTGKGGLKLYFALEGDPNAINYNFGVENFTITTPGGRTIRPENGPILAIYQENRSYSLLSIATQLDVPADGTYTLTMADRNGAGPAAPPDSLKFKIG